MATTTALAQPATADPENRRRISIRPVLILLLIAQISVVGSLVGYLSLANGRQSVQDLVVDLLNEVTSRISESLYTFLTAPQNINNLDKIVIKAGHVDLEDFGKARQGTLDLVYYLYQLIDHFNQVNYDYIGNEHGDFIGVVRRLENNKFNYYTEYRDSTTGGKLFTYLLDSHGRPVKKTLTGDYDPRKRPWYIAAKEHGDAAWSDVYAFHRKPELGITGISRLYNDQGQVRGVLGADIKLSNFSKFMKDLKIGKHGRAFVIERNGFLVATSSPEGLAKKVGEKLERIDAMLSLDPLIKGAAASLAERFSGFKNIDKRYQLSYDDQGQHMLYQVTPVSKDFRLDWLIVVAVPQEDFMEHINANTRWTILLCLLSLIIATIIGVVLTQKMTDPLKNLARLTKELVGQDFSAESPAEQGIERITRTIWEEASNLAGAFSYMIRELQDYITRVKVATAAKERMESELRVAREIQMSVLPQTFPPFPEHTEFELHAHIEPAKEMSGDFFDFYMIDNDHLYFTLGDVSGKGVPASLLMVTCRTLLETIANEHSGEPHKIQNRVNWEISRKNEAMLFVTVFYCILNIRTGQLAYANAGHNLPYLIKANGEVAFMGESGEPALGVMEDFEYAMGTLQLQPGDCVFLYTDGVTEAMSMEGKEYSEPRLEEVLKANHDKPMTELVRLVVADVKKFAAGAPQSDDITTVSMRFLGPPAKADGNGDSQAATTVNAASLSVS